MKWSLILFPLCLLALAPVHAETRDRTVKEMADSVQAKAKRLDADQDGILSPQETAHGREKFGMLAGAIEDAVDANQDGILTVQEYARAQIDEIRRADKDGDGVLTVQEQKRQKQALVLRLLGG